MSAGESKSFFRISSTTKQGRIFTYLLYLSLITLAGTLNVSILQNDFTFVLFIIKLQKNMFMWPFKGDSSQFMFRTGEQSGLLCQEPKQKKLNTFSKHVFTRNVILLKKIITLRTTDRMGCRSIKMPKFEQ